jgi:hypothetical protein
MEVLYQSVTYEDELENKKMSLLLAVPDSLEVFYGLLDHSRKGFVSYSDFRRLAHELGMPLSFDEVATLIADHTDVATPLDMSLGNLALLVWPECSVQAQMLPGSTSNDVKTALYLLKFTVACPGCGARIQRVGNAGCPNVRCRICSTEFACSFLVNDEPDIDAHFQPRDVLSLDHPSFCAIQDFLEVAVKNASAHENLRRQLSSRLWGSTMRDLLLECFFEMTGNVDALTPQGLLRVLRQFGTVTARQSDLLFRRFDRRGRGKFTGRDFVDELTPKVYS